jgi:hypothetical protein
MELLDIDNTLVIDDILSPEQCQSLIAEGSANPKSDRLESDVGYNYHDWTPEEWQAHSILNPLLRTVVKEYSQAFPAIGYVGNLCVLSNCRFKHFPPGYSYSAWHQEHVYNFPHRIGCIIVYLSDHNCGTEFLSTKEVVHSRTGRAMMFPTFWTHTHRGQVCPDNRNRYILGAYLQLIDQPSAYTKTITNLPK